MNKKIYIFSFVIIVLAAMCFPVFGAKSGVGYAGGSPTVPPSRYGNSLHRSPTYSQSQLRNAAITGNIAGGSHFKGSVPYGSSYEFQGQSATGTINSFLRYSTPPNYTRQSYSNPAPYYLPSRTVSTYRMNDGSGYVPPNASGAGQTDSFYNTYRSDVTTADLYPSSRLRLLSLDISDAELRVLRQAQQMDSDYRSNSASLDNDEIREILLGRRDFRYEEDNNADQKEDENALPFDTAKLTEPMIPVEPMVPGMDTLNSFRDERSELQTEIPDELQVDPDETSGKPKDKVEKKEPDEPKSEQEQMIERLYAQMDHQTVRDIIKPYKSFEGYVAAKFNDYITLADSYLKEGKYYKAASAYSFAELYGFDNPRPGVGQGLALFAAGEYLSSGRHFERAILISPDYASHNVKLSELLDKETLDVRISNLAKLNDAHGSSQFSFLLSYIYYQNGDLVKAGEALDKAAKDVQSSPSFGAMRKAINSAMEAEKK